MIFVIFVNWHHSGLVSKTWPMVDVSDPGRRKSQCTYLGMCDKEVTSPVSHSS